MNFNESYNDLAVGDKVRQMAKNIVMVPLKAVGYTAAFAGVVLMHAVWAGVALVIPVYIAMQIIGWITSWWNDS